MAMMCIQEEMPGRVSWRPTPSILRFGNRGLKMKEYNRRMVTKRVKQLFPNKNVKEVMKILDLYGVEKYEQEKHRVQIAILDLCEGKIKKLKEYVKHAKTDYRDVLYWAEFEGK
jgi:hypothetical protein